MATIIRAVNVAPSRSYPGTGPYQGIGHATERFSPLTSPAITAAASALAVPPSASAIPAATPTAALAAAAALAAPHAAAPSSAAAIRWPLLCKCCSKADSQYVLGICPSEDNRRRLGAPCMARIRISMPQEAIVG